MTSLVDESIRMISTTNGNNTAGRDSPTLKAPPGQRVKQRVERQAAPESAELGQAKRPSLRYKAPPACPRGNLGRVLNREVMKFTLSPYH